MPLSFKRTPNYAEIARQLDLEDEGLLDRAFTFLGRPGFAIRSALMGDAEGFARNAARMALDFATLDPIHGMTPDALLPDAPKPEMTDVLRHHGVGLPTSPWGKLAVDVLGGLATDPLTYVTLGGTGIAKGALHGATKSLAGARMVRGLGQTAKGRAALEAAERSVAQRLASQGLTPTALRERAALETLADALPTPAGQQLRAALSSADDALLSGGDLSAKAFDEGLLALESAGKLERQGALRIGLPFTQGVVVGPRNFWSTVYKGTLPSLLKNTPARPLIETAEEAAKTVGEWVAQSFYDATYSRALPKGARDAVRSLSLRYASDNENLRLTVKKLWGDLEESQRREIGGILLAKSDEVNQLPLAERNVEAAWREVEGLVRNQVGDEAIPALKRYRADMEAYHDELVKLGVLKPEFHRDLYIPHQAAAEIAEKIGGTPGSEKWRQALKSVYELRRQHRTLDSFKQAMENFATARGLPASTLDDLVETDIGLLHLRRGLAHNSTRFRRETTTKIKKAGLLQDAAVDRYLKAQFAGIGERGPFRALFQGGNPQITLPNGEKATLFGKGLLPVREGEVKPWRGLNYYYKPALTVFWPAFHGRNFLSAVLMSTLDPDLGLKEGLRAGLVALKEAPVAHFLNTAFGKTKVKDKIGDEGIAVLLRALRTPDDAALAALAAHPETFNGHSLLEVYKSALGAVTSHHMGPHDLALALDRLDTLKHSGVSTTKGVYDRLLDTTLVIGDHIENSFRISSYMALLRKGFTPGEAADKVARAYVDYGINSKAEDFARALIPFFAFSRGITPVVLKQMATRPVASSWIGSVRGAAEDDRALLPEEVRRGIGIPSPFGGSQYVAGLGTPHEAAFQALSPLEGVAGARKALSTVHPVLRAPVELAADKSFYFGTPLSDRSRAPNWAKKLGLGTESTLKSGEKAHSVPPLFNHMLQSIPFSRASSTLDKLLEDSESRNWVDKVVTFFTGVRTVTVNKRRATLRRISDYLQAAKERGEVGFMRIPYDKIDALPPQLKYALRIDRELRRD